MILKIIDIDCVCVCVCVTVCVCVCVCVHLLRAGVLSGCAAADPETFEFSERPCQQTEMAKGFSFIYSLCVCTCL